MIYSKSFEPITIQPLSRPIFCTLMPIFLPNLPTLSELVGQMAQEEVKVLLALVKLVLEIIIQVLDLRLGGCIGHLFAEFRKIFLGMGEIGLSVKLPAGLQMARDNLGWLES